VAQSEDITHTYKLQQILEVSMRRKKWKLPPPPNALTNKRQTLICVTSQNMMGKNKYRASSCILHCNCHFLPASRSCKTHCQTYRIFLRWVMYRSIKTIRSTYLYYNKCWKLCSCTRIHCLHYLNKFKFALWINRTPVLITLGGNIGQLHHHELTAKPVAEINPASHVTWS
jgi:hypothetical protein